MTGVGYPGNHPMSRSAREAATPSAFGSGSPANRQQGKTQRLFGRERELAQLHRLLDADLGGSGGLVLIGGEAGIGKTTLAMSIELEAHRRGIPVRV